MIYHALFHVSSRLALGLSMRLLLDSADEGAGGQNPPPQPSRRDKRPPQNRAKRGPQGHPRKRIPVPGVGQESNKSSSQGEAPRQPRRPAKGKRPAGRGRNRQDQRKQENAGQAKDGSAKWEKQDRRAKGPLPRKKDPRRGDLQDRSREEAKEVRPESNRPAPAMDGRPVTVQASRPASLKEEETPKARKTGSLPDVDELMTKLESEHLAKDPACPPSHFWNRGEVLSRYRTQKVNEILQNEQKQADQELDALRQSSDNLETEIWAAVTSLTHLDVE